MSFLDSFDAWHVTCYRGNTVKMRERSVYYSFSAVKSSVWLESNVKEKPRGFFIERLSPKFIVYGAASPLYKCETREKAQVLADWLNKNEPLKFGVYWVHAVLE